MIAAPLKYTMTAGGSATITDSALVGAIILLVCREGRTFNKTTGTVGNREFSQNSAGGSITFQFGATTEDERVTILKVQ